MIFTNADMELLREIIRHTQSGRAENLRSIVGDEDKNRYDLAHRRLYRLERQGFIRLEQNGGGRPLVIHVLKEDGYVNNIELVKEFRKRKTKG